MNRCVFSNSARRHLSATEISRCLLLYLAPCTIFGCAKPPERPAPAPPRVTVQQPVEREIIDYNEYNGWTDASKTVEIRSRVRGHIKEVAFTDGQLVEKDQLLFQLDPDPFEAEFQAALKEVDVDQANLEFAVAEEERDRELFEKKVTTKAELQKKVATRKSWEAQIQAAKEAVKRRQLDLDYARITAPIAGKISRAQLVVGNLVNAGGSDPLLTTIVAINPMYVYFFVDERALLEYRGARSEVNQRTHAKPLKDSQIPFDFALETDQGFPNHGMLDFADNRINPQTGTIEIRGTVDNPEAKYLPGSRVRVRIPMSDPYAALLIPDTAILSDQDQRYVLSLNDQNVVIRRNVRLGRLQDDGLRVILPSTADGEGITKSDWVIVLGLQRARVNYPAEPMDADGKAIERK